MILKFRGTNFSRLEVNPRKPRKCSASKITPYIDSITGTCMEPYLFAWEEAGLLCWLYCEPTLVPRCMSAWCPTCSTPGLFWLCWDPTKFKTPSACRVPYLYNILACLCCDPSPIVHGIQSLNCHSVKSDFLCIV